MVTCERQTDNFCIEWTAKGTCQHDMARESRSPQANVVPPYTHKIYERVAVALMFLDVCKRHFFIQTVSCPDDQEFSNFHNYAIDKTPRDQKWLRIRLDMIAKINITPPLHLEIHRWSKAISIPVSLSLASLALTKEGKERNPENKVGSRVKWNSLK